MFWVWGVGQDGVVARGVEAQHDLGLRWFFDPEPLGADGDAAIGADLDLGAHAPDVRPPGTTGRRTQGGAFFFFGEVPGALRRLAQLAMNFMGVAMVAQGVDMLVGLGQIGDFFTGKIRRVRPFFNGVLIGGLATAAVAWLLVQQAKKNPEAQQRFEQASGEATDAAGAAIYETGQALKAKLDTLDLTPEQIREELARSGKVVRNRARTLVNQVSDAAGDVRTTGAIKEKLASDPDLSAWSISVSTTAGHVTLDGTVGTEGLVAKAIVIAMETDHVIDVTSKLKVQAKP